MHSPQIHIKDGKKVVRPYADCNKYFRVQSSFATHISRNYKHRATAQLSAQSDNVGCMQSHEENLTPTPCDDKKEECGDRVIFAYFGFFSENAS